MSRVQKIAAVAVIAVLLCGTAVQYHTRDKPTQESVIVTDTYIVMQNDTLWSIAKEHCPPDTDVREYICDIKVRNHLDGTMIYPGQELEIWRIIEKPAETAD